MTDTTERTAAAQSRQSSLSQLVENAHRHWATRRQLGDRSTRHLVPGFSALHHCAVAGGGDARHFGRAGDGV